MITLEFLQMCAPEIAPVTLAAIVQQESGGNPLLLHDNTTGQTWRPATVADSARLATELIGSGHSLDVGLAQINSANFARLALTVESALDPCTNLHAAQSILKLDWEQSGHDLQKTLSAYNTGQTQSRIGSQYSAKVYSKAGVTVPEIPGGQMAAWTRHDHSWIQSTLPAIRPEITWQPAASPLNPHGDGLLPKQIKPF